LNPSLDFIVKEPNHGMRNQIKSHPRCAHREFVIGLIMRQERWIKAPDFSQIPEAQEKTASRLAVNSVGPQSRGLGEAFPIHVYTHFDKAPICDGVLLCKQ